MLTRRPYANLIALQRPCLERGCRPVKKSRRSSTNATHSSLDIDTHKKGKQVILRGSPATTTTTEHLEGVPKEESSGFPIQIQGDFHDFPQDWTIMLKDFLDDDLRSTAQDREKIEPLQW
ncbi:hypothetical protein BHM03_00022125 [Ensete ventricosum]|nr:hypothetical protein BHM03_00022125 [Ensete ventricosum]